MKFIIANKRDNLPILYHASGVIRLETFIDGQFNCFQLASVYVEDCCGLKDRLGTTSKDEDFLRV